MQYHTGAYILALKNYLEKFPDQAHTSSMRFDIRITSPKNKRYQITISDDHDSSLHLETRGLWTCQCDARLSGRGGDSVRVRLKHSDSSRSTDEFALYPNSVKNGVFYSEDGNNYPFSGHFYGSSQLDVNAVNKSHQSVKCSFEFC
jgi:hypothetical protein